MITYGPSKCEGVLLWRETHKTDSKTVCFKLRTPSITVPHYFITVLSHYVLRFLTYGLLYPTRDIRVSCEPLDARQGCVCVTV